MSKQRRADTDPELSLRRLLHARGYRYRVNLKVPGMPRRTMDIGFPRIKLGVFVDGCFWHACPEHATWPANNAVWWAEKLRLNVARDRETNEALQGAGWEVLRIWEHEPPAAAADRVAEMVDCRRAGRE